MSIESVLARMAALQAAFAPPAAASTATTATAATTAASGATTPTAFASALQSATGATGATLGATGAGAVGATTGGGTSAGQAMLNAARNEIGVAESPSGSNNSPRIAQYRQATAGSGVGPWCAYFTSWLARGAGVPMGEQGQGFGAVAGVWGWAQKAGKTIPAGQQPAPGDLIVWNGRHIGIVESVDANGSIHTIEGNSSDKVTRRTYGADGGGATGYVRLG